MTIETGGPAFPGLHPSKECHFQDSGMTLRDYFAGQAIIAYHADGNFSASEDVANWCYKIADAMLEARQE